LRLRSVSASESRRVPPAVERSQFVAAGPPAVKFWPAGRAEPSAMGRRMGEAPPVRVTQTVAVPCTDPVAERWSAVVSEVTSQR